MLALFIVSTASAQTGRVQVSSAGWKAKKHAGGAFMALARLKARPAAGNRVLRPRSAARPAAPASSDAILSAYEGDILARINAMRGARGLRRLRISAGLSRAAAFHSTQMGLRGFFEHESANGAAFWRRIERFYPSRRYRSWSVGENILWGSPDIGAGEAVREWMLSPPHRENLLSREWREIGLGAVHFDSAPGEYRGRPVTIVTADFGTRR